MEAICMKEKLNIERSIELLGQGFKGVTKACYDNLFANLGAMSDLQRKGHKVEPIICFIQFGENLFTRHACFTLDGEIIDTTYATLYSKSKDSVGSSELPRYVLIKRYTLDSYFKAIEKERVTSLDRVLFTRTLETSKKLMANGFFVL